MLPYHFFPFDASIYPFRLYLYYISFYGIYSFAFAIHHYICIRRFIVFSHRIYRTIWMGMWFLCAVQMLYFNWNTVWSHFQIIYCIKSISIFTCTTHSRVLNERYKIIWPYIMVRAHTQTHLNTNIHLEQMEQTYIYCTWNSGHTQIYLEANLFYTEFVGLPRMHCQLG